MIVVTFINSDTLFGLVVEVYVALCAQREVEPDGKPVAL